MMWKWFKKKSPPVELVEVTECLTDITILNACGGQVFGDHVEPPSFISEDVFQDFVRIARESYDLEDAEFIVTEFCEFDRNYCQGVEPRNRNQMFLGFMLGVRTGSKMMHTRISRDFKKA